MDPLYFDSYLKEFESTVVSAEEGIILENTAFYPRSGGQPEDHGEILCGETVYKVEDVFKNGNQIVHKLDKPGLKVGNKVKGVIDWDRRYLLMRYHTASHILSALLFERTGAKITGNQLGLEKSRVDFNLEKYDKEEIFSYEQDVNKMIEKSLPVISKVISKEEAAKYPELVKLAMDVGERENIRVIEIEDLDTQACGGTHVKNTSEIGSIQIVKAENKGKNNRRVYFTIR